MKNILFFLLIISNYSFLIAQSQFQRTFGGTSYDWASCLCRTADSGFVLAGWTSSYATGGDDGYIVKLNGAGMLQWSRTVGGTGTEAIWAIVRSSDGGYAMAGQTNSFGASGGDFYVIKLDASGFIQWNRILGGPNNDIAQSIIQTADGGFAIGGNTFSFGVGMFAVKLRTDGTVQWNKTVGGPNDDHAFSLIQAMDGALVLAGQTFSFGVGNSGDIYVVKLDTSGSHQWT